MPSKSHTIEAFININQVHPQWNTALKEALNTMDAYYLSALLADDQWLPGKHNLLAAFQRDREHCRYILFGESPYPRRESANGIAFYDAAVTDLWGDKGLATAVNKATSLRNLLKTMLLAEGHLVADAQGKITQSAIAQLDKSPLISTLAELFEQLQQQGFLMCNTTPVLHPERNPNHEAKFWQPFVKQLLNVIAHNTKPLPTLILWGKIAGSIEPLEAARPFPKLSSEHPYNVSFIHNPIMQQLFSQLSILQRSK